MQGVSVCLGKYTYPRNAPSLYQPLLLNLFVIFPTDSSCTISIFRRYYMRNNTSCSVLLIWESGANLNIKLLINVTLSYFFSGVGSGEGLDPSQIIVLNDKCPMASLSMASYFSSTYGTTEFYWSQLKTVYGGPKLHFKMFLAITIFNQSINQSKLFVTRAMSCTSSNLRRGWSPVAGC